MQIKWVVLLMVVVAALSESSAAAQDKMYWADFGDDKLSRANLDGSQIEELVTSGLSTLTRIAITPEPATLSLPALGGLALMRRRK